MAMEQLLLAKCQDILNAPSLQPIPNPIFLHHILSLLSDIATNLPSLSHPIFTAILSFSLNPNNSARTTTDALSVLISIAERDRVLTPAIAQHGEGLFLSLCFRPCVSVRHWLLLNAGRFGIRPSLLLTVFLGFTKDPYPYVRREALVALVGLSKSIVVHDRSVIVACYCRAVELLYDMEDCVRCSAVRANSYLEENSDETWPGRKFVEGSHIRVAEWGQLLVASTEESSKKEWSDASFVQICSMVRDMSVGVRVEAFNSLGKVGMVSEKILLQTLSKKVLPSTKEKKYPGQFTAKQCELPASCAAGAFVHGLEDEFHEVRGSACCSLRPLAILSVNFSGEALNLMMDVLNDDSLEVRLNALETMHHMATFGCLRVQEAHMHMFLGTLVDTSSLIRSSARKVLKLAKLNKLAMFKLSVDGLIENLEMYPQDEADVFSAIFHIGRSHGKFTVSIVKEVSQDIEPSSEGKLGFDSAKSAALLMLAISAPLSHEQYICSIPPKIFSYAVILLGRISHGLADVMDKNTLLDYLSRCSRSMVISASEFIKGEEPNVDYQHVVHDEAKECAKHIIAQVNCVWPFIQSGCMGEVLRTLRTWKEELATITMDSYQSSDVLVFALQYLRVIKLLGKVWMHFMSRRKLYSNRIGDLGLIFEKLDKNLLEMRYTFIGLSKEEELHIMELILVTCILRLSSGEDSRHKLALKNLCSTISHLEFLHNEGSVEPSIFVNELKKSLPEIDTSLTGPSHSPFLFQKLLKNFTLKQFLFHGEIKHVNALLEVQNNDCENHLPFVSGLPVGIPFNINLYNTSCEERLWLRMSVNKDYNQFVFIDLKLFGGCNSIRKFTFVAPFYKTPKVDSFTLRVCIGMECFYEDVCLLRDFRGPKRELAYLCKEKEVYMSMVVK
ncbi:hypothetical protein LguiA_016444 [Lonicera macranthoides]